MKRLFTMTLLLAITLFLSCVTVEPVLTSLADKWRGQKAEEFFLRYGLPERSMPSESGGTIYQWKSDVSTFYATSGSITSDIQVYCILNISTDKENKITNIVLVQDTIGVWTSSRFYDIFHERQ